MSLREDIRKAHNYMKRNGLKPAVYASAERLLARGGDKYTYKAPGEEKLAQQRDKSGMWHTRFSIVVPMYRTREIYAREMIESVLNQTYPNFELLLADASGDDSVEKIARTYTDERINYIRLTDNRGISENTNAGIRMASGDYILLLDHDDLMTADALYEMAKYIELGKKNMTEYAFVYSNEDKCDSAGQKFYEPNRKPKFNLDLLLSNNYICHLLAMEATLMKELLLRPEYDGAQDHDLVLRAYAATDKEIGHIDKILYHWRCHEESTASNPESKLYAYEAGRRAIRDFLKSRHSDAAVVPTRHNGFFRVHYGALEGTGGETNGIEYTDIGDIFKNRFDIGVVGGPLIRRNKITGGIMDETKTCPYEDLPVFFSGYMHRASLQQDAYAVDVRNMYIRSSLIPIVSGLKEQSIYRNILNYELINTSDAEYVRLSDYVNDMPLQIMQDVSVKICELIRMEGYLVYYDPELQGDD